MLLFHGTALHLSAKYARLSDGLFPKWFLAPCLEALEPVSQTISLHGNKTLNPNALFLFLAI